MRIKVKNFFIGLSGILLLLSSTVAAVRVADPLPSWNDGNTKQVILAFVAKATTPGSPGFVPPAERIATFDNDGTLWPSHPMYTQLSLCTGSNQSAGAPAPGVEDETALQGGARQRP